MRRFKRTFRSRRKQKVSWVTTLFNETSIAVAGSNASTQVLLERTDWDATESSLSKQGHIRRIIYKGHAVWIPNSTTISFDSCNAIWALFVVDADEAISTINTTAATSPLVEQRVIQVGHHSANIIEVPNAQVGTAFVPALPIDIDVRTRVRMRPGDQLVLCYDFQSDVSSVVSVANYSGICRVLIEEP